ncbi:modular serine protease [Carabus blaptoides fortunei]
MAAGYGHPFHNSSKFACTSGQCIDHNLLCNGAKDCTDGSDETFASCNGIPCQEYSYRCAYGACVDRDSKCNGTPECADGSDESPQICGGTPVTPPVTPSTLSDSSCVLPPQPANGKYTSYVTQSLIKLTYSCSLGYQLSPSPHHNIAICGSGKWYPGLSECLRTCGPRISDSVETVCELQGIEVDCSKPMVEGTTVRMHCKHFYSQVDPSANSLSVCRDGSWDYSFIKCVPDCGKIIPVGSSFIIGGKPVNEGEFPWHVGIYKLNELNQYEQMCGGSIISRRLILSAAHCFTDYANGAPLDVKQYAIAAGKHYRNFYEKKDMASEKRTVKTIIIPERYKGIQTNFTADIAFVILDKALEITHVVQPVCIDWNNQYEVQQLRENNEGVIVGWGSTDEGEDSSEELNQLSVPFVNFTQCYESVPENFTRFLTSDKFCAGFTNGSSVCHADSGGGLVFRKPDTDRYYLRGLISVGPLTEGKCDFRHYGAYTKVSDYMEILRGVEVNTRGSYDSCALPPQPANGKYTSHVTQSLTKLTYSCSQGYQLFPALDNNIAICESGKWYTGLSECLQTCGPRISDSVDTDCEHKGIKVDCSKPMVEGTTVRMHCKHLYSQVDSSANSVSVCSNGSWDYGLIKCVQECGNIVPGGGTLVIRGKLAKKGAIPWHVGIYKLNELNQYEPICGGSIISRKLILSAAHCFTENANGAPQDVNKFAIAAGKYYRNFYETKDKLSQNRTVKKIIIPERYKGLKTSFTADIAFVILDKALELTHVVQPVCIDWNNRYEVAQLRDHNEGIVVGWGYTDEGQDPSEELNQLSVPFVNFSHCFKSVPESFTHFLTNDKFCAGFTNGSSVCNGDSGGGLVFKWPDNKKYYLRGLVSVGPVKEGACDSRQYGVYTKVSDYMETLRDAEVNSRE